MTVAILDGQVLPEQYLPERIMRSAVQGLLRRIAVRPNAEFSARFPERMPCRIKLRLVGGATLSREQNDYEGFLGQPMSCASDTRKFRRLSAGRLTDGHQAQIVAAVAELEATNAADLTALLVGSTVVTSRATRRRCSPEMRVDHDSAIRE